MTDRTAMFMCVRLILALMLIYHLVNATERKCEKIKIDLCQNLTYNMTYTPNRFLHKRQEHAALEINQFWPLIQLNCSPVLKFFLCSLYVPVCNKLYSGELLPCRSVCKQAKTGCLQIMKTYGFKWPEQMECNLFPERKDSPFCMAKENDATKSDLTFLSPWIRWKNKTIGGSYIRKPKPTKTDVSHKFT